MARRFTETKKWTVSFRRLPPRLKCAWLFLWDFCDHAGLWHVDMEALSLYVGEPVTAQEVLAAFPSHIVEVLDGEVWFLPTFLVVQYAKPGKPLELNSKINAHRSALELLAAVGIRNWTEYLNAPAPPGVAQGTLALGAPPTPGPDGAETLRRYHQEQVAAKVGGIFKSFAK